mgnify:FL=1
MFENSDSSGKLVTKYSAFLEKVLEKRWTVIIVSIFLVIGSYMLLPFIGAEFMPKTEGNSFNISVKMNEGTRLERTSATKADNENMTFDITQDSL